MDTRPHAFRREEAGGALLRTGVVASNRIVCREHHRLSFRVAEFPVARPGQFVHLSPSRASDEGYTSWDEDAPPPSLEAWRSSYEQPMLRRAYSVVAMRRDARGVVVDVIHRVVGKSTRWLASLAEGDELSVLGPLGNEFPLSPAKPHAWMIGGGVGVPPMMLLAPALRAAGRRAVALCGAQSGDLFCFGLNPHVHADAHAVEARTAAVEFAEFGVPVILSTDDGSVGFHGHVGAALSAYHGASGVSSDELVVYACGPERMLAFVAGFCLERGIECQLCMERAMACGLGTCQSCAVPVHDPIAVDGWRYRLCCTDGPVFEASRVIF